MRNATGRNRRVTHRYFCPECHTSWDVEMLYETDTGANIPKDYLDTKCPECDEVGVSHL